ncbi:hypothetical protein N9X61_04740 [Sulfurimonas sp.]|nr:hypothetical protein [Sulfurimonas sp.]
MELKDVILSTLAEMEEEQVKPVPTPTYEVKETLTVKEVAAEKPLSKPQNTSVETTNQDVETCESEIKYLNSIKERLLVLFEGFQAPNNTNIEAKIDMTLNFLEYTLATIDSRVEILEKGKK